ncbi:MAG: hypothetical protein Q9161_000079 [Pseudevernia consocians]
MSPRPAVIKDFCARLRSARVKNADSKHFVPDEILDSIFKDLDVDLCVREIGIPVYHQQESTVAIRSGGRKVFSILAALGCEALIVELLSMDGLVKKSDIDNKLPFEMSKLRNVLGSDVASQFYELQWEFIAPFFREDRSHRLLHKDTIMPFVGRKKLADGGFGIVFRETMAEKHHGLDCSSEPDGKVRIVRKELISDDFSTRENSKSENRFRAEERLLLLLRELRHPNIVRFLASYTVKTPHEVIGEEHVEEGPNAFQYVHNLLFPLADLPLSQLLKDHENRILRRHFPSDDDLYQQLWCLSSAIQSLHNYFVEEHDLHLIGCHFDLAPRNILIDKGRLLLADFGLSRLRNENSRSTTPFEVGRGDYIAPECEPIDDEMFTKGWYGRPSDIWSFGCILAEIVTFMKYGADGTAMFHNARLHQVIPHWYCTQFHVRGTTSDEVRRWLEKLRIETSISQQRILILVEKMLSIDPKQRPKAADVTVNLFTMAQKCLWDTISTKFNDLVNEQSNLELRIERERLLVWASICGLENEFNVPDNNGEISASQYLVKWLQFSKEELFAVSELLKSFNEEITSLSTTNKVDHIPRPMGIRLRELNESLWKMAELPAQRRMEVLLENRILRMCESTLTELKSFSAPNPQSGDRLEQLIAMKYFISKINEDAETGKSTSHDRLHLKTSSVRIGDLLLGAHGIGVLYDEQDSNRRCLFEWIKYDVHWIDQKNDELYNRVGEIAELFNMGLPYGCQVLRCEGYFHRPETHSFGLVFPYPNGISTQSRPVTLKKAIHRLNNRPLLGDIFELACSLAYTLLVFHKVGWLHKQVSSYNIIFFDVNLPSASTRSTSNTGSRPDHTGSDAVSGQSLTTTERPSLSRKVFSRTSKLFRPNETRTALAKESTARTDQIHSSAEARKAFIVPEPPQRSPIAHEEPASVRETTVKSQELGRLYLIGFNHSRPNTKVAFTEGPHTNPGEEDYQHPQYANHGSRQRFQPGYDYYSVGLVLLEMGLWVSLSDLIEGDIEDFTPLQQQRFWLENAVPLLGQSMGAMYRNAVAFCLGDALLEMADPLEGFEINVVDQLKKCRA